MEQNQPSRTAQGAAMHRAAHQLVDPPPIFTDPLAMRIIGEEAATELREGRDVHTATESAGLRAFVAVRSRFTEDCLIAAMARGVRQYVLLGAGLDTFAYRGRHEGLHVFEVDHPATQSWKRARLAEVLIAVPDQVTYAPVDFESETLRDGLARAGFDFGRPAMFAWLGVTPYLTRDAVMATLAFVASLAKGSEVIFDYRRTRPRKARNSARISRRWPHAWPPPVNRFEASSRPSLCSATSRRWAFLLSRISTRRRSIRAFSRVAMTGFLCGAARI